MTKFFRCEHCGNIITKIIDGGVKVVCCGEEMIELEAHTADSSVEKHVPVIQIDGAKVNVTVGSTLHPMIDKHFIQWIYLETTHGGQFYYLKAGEKPMASFCLAEGEKVIAAYEYCNIHGLWVANV